MPRAGKGIQVDGVQEAIANVNKILRALDDPDVVAPTFVAVANVIAVDARRRVRRKTGNLGDNIFAGPRRTKIPSAVVGVRKKKAPYSWYLEYGTSHMQAFPYLRPAAAATAGECMAVATEAWNRLLENTLR